MPIINLNKKLHAVERQRQTRSNGRTKSRAKRILIVLAVFIILIIVPLFFIYNAGKKAVASSKVLATGVKQENLDQIKLGVNETKKAVDELNGTLTLLIWLKAIPFVGGYYSDIKHFASAGSSELGAMQVVVESIEPYKQELGLTGQVTPGQDKIAQGVKILDKILPQMDKIEPYLNKARKEVEEVDTGKYPEEFKGRKVRNLMEAAKNFIIGADIAVSEHRDAIAVAPEALGARSPKTYLLLFQNDKEIRPTGGFLTAYAFLKLDKGHLSTTVSDDIYRLDERLLNVCKNVICPLTPPAPIIKYLPEVDGKARTAWSMRDSNISPDLPTSIKDFEKMYAFLGDDTKFDGIITIDTQVVEELINITGPIDVFATKYSAEKDKRCNCPNVIYELEHYAEVAAKGEAGRKAILGTLMQQILARSLGSIMDKLPQFISAGVRLANDKHVMFYNNDQKTQSALSKLNWTGEIKPFEGDYLHINDANFAGGKTNLYITEKVNYDVKVENDGTAKVKLTIEYKNPQPYNTWLNAIYRDYVRAYVPRGAKLISNKGSDDPVNTVDDKELNKTYFEAFITVRPQNSRTLSYEYSLPYKIQTKQYPLLIQKQPGAKDHHYIIKINGSTKAEFDLTSDKTLNLSY